MKRRPERLAAGKPRGPAKLNSGPAMLAGRATFLVAERSRRMRAEPNHRARLHTHALTNRRTGLTSTLIGGIYERTGSRVRCAGYYAGFSEQRLCRAATAALPSESACSSRP